MEEFADNVLEGGEADELIPFEEESGSGVSHAPLILGDNKPAQAVPVPKAKPVPAAVKSAPGKQAQVGQVVTTERITGVKTFFTKLHVGALEFLDEQIGNWLKKNPGINVKMTNTVTGEVIGKKIEPNILITIWY